ncbi:MAG: N-acetylglucosamine-6-phosphate deacetylase [Oscillospiraceae bacterium]|nr:N-acetylglucosamine-6-phosphate deacetylase [Oscillospiraceae bacterium]
MLFTNAQLFRGDGFAPGSFRVEAGVFSEVLDRIPDGEGIDLGGAPVIPGLVDIHTHGNSGADFSDGDYEGLKKMAAYSARSGVTSFAPTSMTLPYETLARAFAAGRRLADEQPGGCARIMGIHMEGPFFSEKKKGAQNAAYLRLPDAAAFQALYDGCGGLIRIADVAAELEGAEGFTRAVSGLCTVSIAHTDADYEAACRVFDAGARHVTHLFNAMPPLHHRKPGVIGAAAEREEVVAELIGDGLHIHPSVIRLAFRLFPERLCIISDSLRCCGMPDGEYELGGQPIWLKGRLATLADGTIAGSASNLYDCLLTVIGCGVPREQAIRAATILPARELGCADRIGSIEPGKYADFVVCGPALERRAVYLGGERVE